MKLYTFIFEYKGGTYISQFEAKDIKAAYQLWCDNLNYKIITGMNKAKYKKILAQTSDVSFSLMFDCKNIWCAHFIYKGFMTIVLTEKT